MLSILPDAVVTTTTRPVTINVLANDAGDALTITSFSKPSNGSLVFNADKTFTYTPAGEFVGDDGFSYTVRDGQGTPASIEVTISVLPDDGATVATDDIVEVVAAGDVIIPVLANDMVAGAGSLRISAVSVPGHGAVNVLPDQTIRYVPQRGFVGIDSFNYTIVDEAGSSATATVTIKVLASNSEPLAVSDAFTIEANATTILAVLNNDSDPEGGPLQVVGFTMPNHGELAFNPDKTFTYTPDAGYQGPDQFSYTIRDGQGASAAASVVLDIAEIGESAIAIDDRFTTTAGTPVTVDVLANDTLPAEQSIMIVAVTLPFKGRLTFNPDKTIIYIPNAGFVGTDDFTYTIGNGKGDTSKATVTVDVMAASSVDVYPNGYAYRRRLAIPGSSAEGSSHENFPLWVELTGSWLKSTDNGGKVISLEGHDLHFELADGTSLAHELEHYDPVDGKLGAWVRLPELRADQPTVLLLYYGKAGLAESEADPQTVWQDYLAVWHLPGTSDRSGQGRDLVALGDVQTAALGLGAGSVALDGAGVLKIDDASWLNNHDVVSVQLRSKAASTGHDRGQLHIGSFDAGTSSVMGLRYQAFGSGAEDPTNVVRADLKTSVGEMSVASASGSQTTDWQDIAMVWELGDSAPTLYLDGKRIQPSFTVQSSGDGAIVAEGPLYIGAGSQDSAAGGWSGLIDEVRFKAEKLDPARLQAEHANQNDPTYFFGFGAEETFDEGHASIIAVPLEATTLPGKWIDLDVLAEAVLPSDNDGVSIQSITQPTNGNVSVINGKIRYSPTTSFSGSDSFSYTLVQGGKTSTSHIRIEVTATQSDYLGLVDASMPLKHYRLAELSGTVIGDRIGSQDGTWRNAPRLGMPALVERTATGASVGLKGGATPAYGEIEDLVTTASFTIDMAVQLDRRPSSKFTVITTGGGSTPGDVCLEVEADAGEGARLRFWSVDGGGNVVVWRTDDGSAPIASAFKLSLRRDGGTGALDVFVNGMKLPKTLISGSVPSSWVAPAARTWRLGEWPGTVSTPYEGLIAELVVWDRPVAAQELQILALARNVVWLDDFNAGDVEAQNSTLIDLAAHAHPTTGFVPSIVQAGSLGTASVSGSAITYDAGATIGDDEIRIAIATNDSTSRTATLSVSVLSAKVNAYNRGEWFGSAGWGASAGNGTGVGRYSTSKYWAFRFKAPFSATCDRLRWNLPRRAAYKGGTGGDMRVTIRRDNGSGSPDLSSSGIVWQSQLFVFSSDSNGTMRKHSGINYFYGFGTDEGAEIIVDASLEQDELYHIVWTNENPNPGTNWFSINHAWNASLPQDPYHPYALWQGLATLAGNSSNVFSFAGNRFIPYFQCRRADDELWFGQNYFDCGTTTNIMSIAGGGTKDGNVREIGGNWQVRQRWTHTAPTTTVRRWRGRVWRRNDSTADPLRVRLECEESGGGVTTLADVSIPASSIFQTDHDNQSGQIFAPIDVPLGATVSLENGKTYRLRLSSGSSTLYAMRAPNGYSKTDLNVGWGGWQGRGEYSTDGGASWTGMHMYGTDNRSDCDWSMALHDTEL